MNRISRVVLILCACFVSVAWGEQPTCSNDWTEFHRPNMQRRNPCEKVLNVNNVGKLILKWSYTTGEAVNSSPAVANGVVYVGSNDGNVGDLCALDAKTGAHLWAFPIAVTSSPAVANGVVYIGSEDKNVYALNATTGAKLWSYTTGLPVTFSPALANGVVYIGSDDNVYALNAETGAKLWTYTTAGQVTSSPRSPSGRL